ncbi:MAG: flagellar hook-basal body protein [Lachnospiraceae bacterium]|nr:flagellar hook-basal body protein [Lachnospiraceae bacterium]
MVKGLYTAYTGMRHQQNRMDILSNNMANSATVGFKKEGATNQAFKDVLAYRIKDTTDGWRSAGIGKMNLGVKIGESYTDYSQGAFHATDNVYDLALGGNGFFAIEYKNKAGEISTKYTRDGSFTLTAAGELVTKDGDFVLDTNGKHIRIDPMKETAIDDLGNISQGNGILAKIRVVDFEDYNYLEHFGENMYQPVEGYQLKASDAKIFSGYQEQSNVTVVSEMVELISISRAYESNQKVIQTIDGSLEIAANQLGKLNG